MPTAEVLKESKVRHERGETNTKDRGRSWEIKAGKTRPGSGRSEPQKTTRE